jgi:hypothetical protein
MHSQLYLSGRLAVDPEILRTRKDKLMVKVILETELVPPTTEGNYQSESVTLPVSFFTRETEAVRDCRRGDYLAVGCHLYGTEFKAPDRDREARGADHRRPSFAGRNSPGGILPMNPLSLADVRRILPGLQLPQAFEDHDLDHDIVKRLKKKGVNPDGFTLQAAETLLSHLKERQECKLCTLKQAAALEKFGFQQPALIPFDDVNNQIQIAKVQMAASGPVFLENLLANPPTAGSGVHSWLFCVARQLHAHMGTREMEKLLAEQVQACGRHVPIHEIREAIKHSASCAWSPTEENSESFSAKPEPKNPQPNVAAIDRIVTSGIGLYDLWERSEIRFGDSGSPPQTEYVIDSIFPGNPLLCVGKSQSQFSTRRRNVWRGHLSRLPFIVPNPMTKVTGKTKDGRLSEHTLEATGTRTWQVLEFDFSELARDGATPTEWKPLIESWKALGITIADVCSALLWELGTLAPLVLVVFSGGKSLHGWFKVAGATENQLREFSRTAMRLGACSSTLNNPSQFVRIPDGLRDNGARQLVWYFRRSLL